MVTSSSGVSPQELAPFGRTHFRPLPRLPGIAGPVPPPLLIRKYSFIQRKIITACPPFVNRGIVDHKVCLFPEKLLAAIPKAGGSIPHRKLLAGHRLLAQGRGTIKAPKPALRRNAPPNKGSRSHFSGTGPRFPCQEGEAPKETPAARAATAPSRQWTKDSSSPIP